MGSFNSQYQNYYNNLLYGNRSAVRNSRNFGIRVRPERKHFNITKRFMQELTGVFVLIIFVTFCKAVMPLNTKALEVYKYSKNLVNQNYDYVSAFNEIKKINYKDLNYKNIQSRILNFIENLRLKMNEMKIYGNKTSINTEISVNKECLYVYMGDKYKLNKSHVKDSAG